MRKESLEHYRRGGKSYQESLPDNGFQRYLRRLLINGIFDRGNIFAGYCAQFVANDVGTETGTQEAAEQTYMKSGLVAHRVSLAHTGRDPAHQVTANLVGSPQSIIDKIHQLRAMGVDHCAAMAVAVNTQEELLEQMRWFAEEVMPHIE